MLPGDLTDPFVFCVYDQQDKRHVLDCSAVHTLPGNTPWVHGMWFKGADEIPNLRPREIRVSFNHSPAGYRTPDDEARRQIGYQTGTVFCAFVQGVVLGWDTIVHDSPELAEGRDEIPVRQYAKHTFVDEILEDFGLDERGLRMCCREDLLLFAVHHYEGHSTGKAWRAQDFLQSGFARLPYRVDVANELILALLGEEKFRGTYADREGGHTAQLEPTLYDVEVERKTGYIRNWIERLQEIGARNGWIPAPGEIDSMPDPTPRDPSTVFVVVGRDERARKAMFAFLRAIGLRSMEWSEAVSLTAQPTPYIGDVLKSVFATDPAIVVLMTPDDEARLREPLVRPEDGKHERELTGQARPNVLFEAGIAMGRSPDRTVIVEVGKLRPFNDIAGRHVIRWDGSSQRSQELAQRLKSAGCPVNLDRTDWHTAGDF